MLLSFQHPMTDEIYVLRNKLMMGNKTCCVREANWRMKLLTSLKGSRGSSQRAKV